MSGHMSRTLLLSGACLAARSLLAAVDLSFGEVYRQTFAGCTNSLPAGWLANVNDDPATPQPDNGKSTAGRLYSYGEAGSDERALGSLASGTARNIRYGVVLRNTTGFSVAEVAVACTGEQWRCGAVGTTNTLVCRHAILAEAPASLAALEGTELPGLSFVSPAAGVVGALDGHAAANRAALAAVFAPVSELRDGHCLVLWWHGTDAPGGDHGLAIDDLSIRWTALAPPAPEPRLLAFWHCNDVVGDTTLKSLRPFGSPANQSAYVADGGAVTNAAMHVWEGLVGDNGGAAGQNFGAYGGTTKNWPEEIADSVTGGALAILGNTNNGHHFELRFDRAVTDCVLSYATCGSSTGFTGHFFRVSVDGGTNWLACGAAEAQRSDTFVVRAVDLGAVFGASYGPARNRLRIVVDGAGGGSGANRFDNILLRGAFPLALVELRAVPDGCGTVAGGGWVEVGTPAVFHAAATRPGWRFAGWSDGARTAARSVVVPAEGLFLAALYAPEGTLLLVR